MPSKIADCRERSSALRKSRGLCGALLLAAASVSLAKPPGPAEYAVHWDPAVLSVEASVLCPITAGLRGKGGSSQSSPRVRRTSDS